MSLVLFVLGSILVGMAIGIGGATAYEIFDGEEGFNLERYFKNIAVEIAFSLGGELLGKVLGDAFGAVDDVFENGDEVLEGVDDFIPGQYYDDIYNNYMIDMETLKYSDTVAGHTDRFYNDSIITMEAVMSKSMPIVDYSDGVVSGALKWEGTIIRNGREAVYELVIDPSTNTVWHWLIK